MGRERSDSSMVRKALQRLCLDFGWSYGVFWRLHHQESSFLTMEDAFCEEQMGFLIDNMRLQVHMLGNGAVGQAAFTKRHRWMVSDTNRAGQNLVGSIQNQDMFQDDSEIHCQFSSGIETIALIPVESHGVLQFGSTQKITEKMEFVDQTKRLFREIDNDDVTSILPENMTSSSNNENCGQSRLFASLISSGNSILGNLKPMHPASSRNYMGTNCSSIDPPRFSPFTSDHQMMYSSHLGNQFQMASTSAPLKLPNLSNSWLEEPLLHSTTSFSQLAAPSPCISTWSRGQSTLTSIEQQLPSQTRLVGSQFVSPANANSLTSCSTGGLVDTENSLTSPSTFQALFRSGDFTMALSRSFPGAHYAPWIVPSLDQTKNTLATPLSQNLSQPMEVPSLLASQNGADILGHLSVNHPSNSVQSSITNTFISDGDNKFLNDPGVEDDLLDFEFVQAGDFLDDILIPEVSGGLLDFSTDPSERTSEQCVSSGVGPHETLFSKLGLDQFFDGISGSSNSIASSSFEDDLSSGSKRKMGSYLGSGDQVQLKSHPFSDGNTNLLKPLHNLGRSHNLESKKEVMPKSEAGSCVGDSYSITCGSKHKRPEEPMKVARKRARPGSRPKPKDRQQIQDRMADLRKLIPNGGKVSMDTLLALTIKHILFLQSVTNHAEKLKQAEDQKVNEIIPRDSASSSVYSAMWASEVGSQTPVDVKDLCLPGQKLIQMLYEEKGYFLEIVDVIQGLGLTILKGFMEVRENKIWACFIVEAEANRHVTKQEISVFLRELLRKKATSEINVADQIANVLNGGSTMFNSCHQSVVPFPISLAETLN